MDHKINLRLPIEIYDDLHSEAQKNGLSISTLVRQKLCQMKYGEADPSSSIKSVTKVNDAASESKADVHQEIKRAQTETILLLREFLFERNAQVLKRVDATMEKKFGKGFK